MPVRVVLLEGSVAAGATWTKIDEKTVPSGETWRLREMRIYANRNGAYVRLYRTTGTTTMSIADTIVDVSNTYKLPLPLDEECPAGTILSLEASNPTGSGITIYVEIVYELGS